MSHSIIAVAEHEAQASTASDASSAANDWKTVVNYSLQSIQKLANNVEATRKVDGSLAVITEIISRITSMNEHVARFTGNQKNVAIIISHHVDEIHNHTEKAAASSSEFARLVKFTL